MHPIVFVLLAFAAGIVVGSIYGRKVEQKLIADALDEFEKGDAATKAVVGRVRTRWALLKKAL